MKQNGVGKLRRKKSDGCFAFIVANHFICKDLFL